eukprot:1964874-Rhodomonas_salina.1
MHLISPAPQAGGRGAMCGADTLGLEVTWLHVTWPHHQRACSGGTPRGERARSKAKALFLVRCAPRAFDFARAESSRIQRRRPTLCTATAAQCI